MIHSQTVHCEHWKFITGTPLQFITDNPLQTVHCKIYSCRWSISDSPLLTLKQWKSLTSSLLHLQSPLHSVSDSPLLFIMNSMHDIKDWKFPAHTWVFFCVLIIIKHTHKNGILTRQTWIIHSSGYPVQGRECAFQNTELDKKTSVELEWNLQQESSQRITKKHPPPPPPRPRQMLKMCKSSSNLYLNKLGRKSNWTETKRKDRKEKSPHFNYNPTGPPPPPPTFFGCC